jgi:hypothetical protein
VSGRESIPADAWDVSAWRLHDGNHLDVHIGVRVDPADQKRLWTLIEKAVREQLASEIESKLPNTNSVGEHFALRVAASIARGES